MAKQVPNEVDGDPVVTSAQEIVDGHPLVSIFGGHAKARIITALYTTSEPLNPDRIVDRADIGSSSWYNYRDELLAAGIIEKVGNAGNSPLYELTDDERRDAIDTIATKTGLEEARSDDDPEPPN